MVDRGRRGETVVVPTRSFSLGPGAPRERPSETESPLDRPRVPRSELDRLREMTSRAGLQSKANRLALLERAVAVS